ncbi:hypothetical protein P3T43_007179, partial [Paraburkholderia sp. GAS41]
MLSGGTNVTVSTKVVPPLLTEFRSRGHAAMGNFCFGGTPPMAVF